MSKLGTIVHALMQRKGREDPVFSFEPAKDNIAQALNSAFLIILAGASHPAFERARSYLESMTESAEWGEVAKFYVEGESLVQREIISAVRDDADFADRFDRLSAWISRGQNLADVKNTAERFWAVFFPEANGLLSHREDRIEELRSRRRVTITRLNSSPLTDPARELLFSSNVLLTLPLGRKPLDELPLSAEAKERPSGTRQEPQLFWYDHPIPVGLEPGKNEVLYGLKGLDKALEFERERGHIPRGSRPVCVLSVSVTHRGLRGLARSFIQEELARSGGLKMIDLYAFTEADTRRIVARILGPAGAHYLRRKDTERLLGVFGVDGEYGRHYSFLKAIAAFWKVLIDPRIKATFKIDLDQVFPQKELVAETGCSAFEHFRTPLWGAQGLDAQGRPVELGMIAGALVNAKDIDRSLFSCDVPFPDHEPSFDEFIFFSFLPQALSTEAEMMARYDRDDLDGQRACLQRIHVTGGTNGILVDSLRRHRPFTPSFVGRAEDQAYILSALLNPGIKLAYVHKDGLIMRHDKEAFAQEAMASAFVGKLIGDYIRIITFSAYARALTDNIRELKETIDPFTGCFVSFIPATVVYLRFAFKAASFFALGKNVQGVQFIKDGAARLRKALDFARGKDSPLEQTYVQERTGWDLFYETLSVVEDAIATKDEFALDLQKKARAIINSCAISAERSY
ncbi:MAG TPA: hypothetical protein VMW46_05205 [Candidatus Desulfaltia sp.]|nr:hypothetical protein [Candidatus Desulfaltia sp.]